MASGSHCTSITTFHVNYAMKLIEQIANARLNIVVSPMPSTTCLKAMTRVAERWDAGVNIAFRRGRVIAREAPRTAQVFMDNHSFDVDFRRESVAS